MILRQIMIFKSNNVVLDSINYGKNELKTFKAKNLKLQKVKQCRDMVKVKWN